MKMESCSKEGVVEEGDLSGIGPFSYQRAPYS
jgi:hypothetical protein